MIGQSPAERMFDVFGARRADADTRVRRSACNGLLRPKGPVLQFSCLGSRAVALSGKHKSTSTEKGDLPVCLAECLEETYPVFYI